MSILNITQFSRAIRDQRNLVVEGNFIQNIWKKLCYPVSFVYFYCISKLLQLKIFESPIVFLLLDVLITDFYTDSERVHVVNAF